MREEGLSEEQVRHDHCALSSIQCSFQQKQEKRIQHAMKETEFLRLKRSRLGVEDFTPIKVIGRGAFGEGWSTLFYCTTYTINIDLYSFAHSETGAKERYRSRVRHEDIAQGRHAREGAGSSCPGGA